MLACRPIYAFQRAILLHVAPQLAMIIHQYYFLHIYSLSFHPDPYNHIESKTVLRIAKQSVKREHELTSVGIWRSYSADFRSW